MAELPDVVRANIYRADGTVLFTPGEDVTVDVGPPEVQAAERQQQTVRNTTSSTGETYRIVTVPLGRFDTADTSAWRTEVGWPVFRTVS